FRFVVSRLPAGTTLFPYTTLFRSAADEAQALWDMIHGGRNAAFSELGGGYGDWANYRWQAHKKSGVVDALRAIVSMRKRAISESERALYRRELPDPDRSKIAALIRRT